MDKKKLTYKEIKNLRHLRKDDHSYVLFPKLVLGDLVKKMKDEEKNEDIDVIKSYSRIGTDIYNNLRTNFLYKQEKLSYVFVNHLENIYLVMKIRAKGRIFYPIFDLQDYKTIYEYKVPDKEDGYWTMKDTFVGYSKKNYGKVVYLHDILFGKKVYYLNRNKLDNRRINISDIENKSNVTKAGPSQANELYRDYYLSNKTDYINWFPIKKSHIIVAGPYEDIKKRKFRAGSVKQLPVLMRRGEKYLLEEIEKRNIPVEKILIELDEENYKRKREYEHIVMKGKLFLD
jgi:hypothetical protein